MISKRKWQIVSSLVLAGLVICLAIFVAHESSKQVNIQAEKNGDRETRTPASIGRVFDFSNLQGSALETAAKQRLLSSLVIAKDNSDAVVEMGNYVLTNENSEKDFACGFYDQVEVDFDAEGVAVSGDIPHITVQTGCAVANNINSFVPIRIPIAKLKAAPPSDSVYEFYNANVPLKVQMSNSPPDWPGQWVLTDVKLTSSQNPSRILHLQSSDIKAANGSMKMNW